tara:strand:+ start:460 stop:744 length:285 start_codon:yes stop_codon:yes gene_type:complete
LNPLKTLIGNNKLVNNLTGLFVGEDSKKRQMGIIAMVVISTLYFFGVFPEDLYEQAMMVCLAWTGVAYRSRMKKIMKSVESAKTKRNLRKKRKK